MVADQAERANPHTRIDDAHAEAWSEGNLVRPLVDGAAYFADLHEHIEAAGEGDLILFTDWQGSPDERLTGTPGSEVVEVFRRAEERGAGIRGLVWRSHWDKFGFFHEQNAALGEQLQERGAQVLLDMRVRTGGAHHQKFVVIRHRDDPSRDIAYVGGIDLAHTRRDTCEHRGDPQGDPMAEEYGDTPPWHDVQAAIHGPAVHDVETVFRERWEDPTRLTRHPLHWAQDKLRGLDMEPDPLPAQAPPPPPAGSHVVQLLRTYPNLRRGREHPYARGGERSVARGYTKALERACELTYIEDQYLWGKDIARVFKPALESRPELHIIAVLPLLPDLGGAFSRVPQMLGRQRAAPCSRPFASARRDWTAGTTAASRGRVRRGGCGCSTYPTCRGGTVPGPGSCWTSYTTRMVAPGPCASATPTDRVCDVTLDSIGSRQSSLIASGCSNIL